MKKRKNVDSFFTLSLRRQITNQTDFRFVRRKCNSTMVFNRKVEKDIYIITVRENGMIRQNKNIITLGINLSSIYPPRWALTTYILLCQL